MTDAVVLALIVAVPTVLTSAVVPVLMHILTANTRRQEKLDDYARQDRVAELLARSAKTTNEKLDIIEKTGNDVHILVNSQLTNIKQSLRTTLTALVAALKDTKWPNKDTEAAVVAAKEQIAILDSDLADRSVQQAKVNDR